MNDKHFISVFRSARRADTYLYVRRGQDLTRLPEPLREVFGQPVHAMDLVMTRDRKLARTSGADVLDAIAEKDFFLQMPDKADSYIVEFREKLRKHPS